jgi:hypothetical protein
MRNKSKMRAACKTFERRLRKTEDPPPTNVAFPQCRVCGKWLWVSEEVLGFLVVMPIAQDAVVSAEVRKTIKSLTHIALL